MRVKPIRPEDTRTRHYNVDFLKLSRRILRGLVGFCWKKRLRVIRLESDRAEYDGLTFLSEKILRACPPLRGDYTPISLPAELERLNILQNENTFGYPTASKTGPTH